MSIPWAEVRYAFVIAGVATAISLAGGVWVGYRIQGNRKASAIASLFLILPPTVICALLLLPIFNWWIAAAAASLYGMPFLARTSRIAFQAVPRDYTDAARGLGAPESRVFWRIVAPLSYRPVLAGAAIIFTRVLTEFAAALWIASKLHSL